MAIEQPVASRVTVSVSVETTPPPAWRQVGESMTWTPVTVPKAALEVIVMVLPPVRAAVALKNTSRLVEAKAVAAVGEIVTPLTAPVCEPIR
jgi:hypothetical protein